MRVAPLFRFARGLLQKMIVTSLEPICIWIIFHKQELESLDPPFQSRD